MKLNGKVIKNKNIKTLQQLLDLYKINKKSIAVLVNGNIIKKEKWKSHNLTQTDSIEIVSFVGGG